MLAAHMSMGCVKAKSLTIVFYFERVYEKK